MLSRLDAELDALTAGFLPGAPVLVAALNWGLGHATRSVPLVRALQFRGFQVHLASDGVALAFWRREFPSFPAHELPAWGIRYAPGPRLLAGLVLSLPHVFRALRCERDAVRALHARHHFAAVFSDNRYGVHVAGIPSVLLTHQPHPALPPVLRLLENPLERAMARLCRPFDALWIPDVAPFPGLSGRLGHPRHPEFFPPLRYLGPLSRFSPQTVPMAWDAVAVISGPEPARTLFDRQLRRELSRLPGRFLLVRGRPDLADASVTEGSLTVVPHLPGPELSHALAAARTVICRGGYSTLMDLATLGNAHALLVPTPGQTEQENLAAGLSRAGLAHAVPQTELDLARDLPLAASRGPLSRL